MRRQAPAKLIRRGGVSQTAVDQAHGTFKIAVELAKANYILGANIIDMTDEELAEILTVDKETWRQELEGIKGWYAKFDHLPEELLSNLAKLEEDLK